MEQCLLAFIILTDQSKDISPTVITSITAVNDTFVSLIFFLQFDEL
jgi:hypothetical protein